MPPLKIAVIGSGISGLSAAWLLSKNHDVTLFEAEDRWGGHSNTVEMEIDGKNVPVDTGFICFNEAAYPNLIQMFKHLDVPVHSTNMSFAASLNNGAYEYSGGTYTGIFGQPANLFKLGHWRMIRDILRFFKEAYGDLDTLNDEETLTQYLKRKNYSQEFAERHLLPMAAAIWSSKMGDMMGHPAKAFIRFFQNHGLLQVTGRPKWGTVEGGSTVYVQKLLADANFERKIACPIVNIIRSPNKVTLETKGGSQHNFDHVVVASHADQALAMLGDPSQQEQHLLGSFEYAKNTAVLHRDKRLMPKRKLVWASWNYLDSGRKQNNSQTSALCVTYWMNSLQNLPTNRDVFVTLNPENENTIENVAARFDYMHPVFNSEAMSAQRQLWSLQGVNRTWFCGAHFGAGFHEDGLQSGLAVAEQLGGAKRPWNAANESGRIFLHPPPSLLEAAE